MTDATLRCSLFDVAVSVDVPADRVTFMNWKRRKDGGRMVTLQENAVLNLFLLGGDLASVSAGVPVSELAETIDRLQSEGLLVRHHDWERIREQHPYVNLPSLWEDRPESPRHFDNYDDAYAEDAVPWNRLPLAEDLVSLVPLPGRKRERLLDVGCGSGHNLRLMEDLGFACWGIDISRVAIDRLKKMSATPENFVAGSATRLPWSDASFDVVTDIGCLHCLYERERDPYVDEVCRVLAPGGRYLCRAFKPRDASVVAAQPVNTERLGLDPDEVVGLFDGRMSVQLVKEGPVHGLYMGVRSA